MNKNEEVFQLKIPIMFQSVKLWTIKSDEGLVVALLEGFQRFELAPTHT
jgi:hypothetical protein